MMRDPPPAVLAESSASARFGNNVLDGLPTRACRYLEHAIAPGTILATSVRLRMHGQTRLRGWQDFSAVQTIHSNGDMRWQARTKLFGLPVSGYDQLLGGAGRMRWRLLGMIPLLSADGNDVTRSAAGRVAAESVWLPSRLCDPRVAWSSEGAQITAAFDVQREHCALKLDVGDDGRLRGLCVQRWGNPDGSFGAVPFGGIVEEERRFAGYVIPSRLRIGWHFGTDRFDTHGEFFRVVVDDAQFG